MSALLSFLGGSVFRMIFGEVISYLNKKQDHAHELERLEVQAKAEAEQHERTKQMVQLQADLGVKVIEAKSEAAIDEIEAQGWLSSVNATSKQVGVKWLDAWNASIRPGVATWSVAMMTLAEFGVFALSENAVAVCSAALGIYLAERSLFKRGK